MPHRSLEAIFANNQRWAEAIKSEQPDFFKTLAEQQSPDFLWIGCADSRVPANEIMGLLPGEVFVHRNVANVVVHTDFNCLSVIQYAVDVLKVRHIIVTGHYGCGGVRAALENRSMGLIDNWLRHIKDVYIHHQRLFDHLDTEEACDLLCELNVCDQVAHVCHTTIVQDAWKRGQHLTVHGLVYSLEDGILHDLAVNVSGMAEISTIYRMYSDQDMLDRLPSHRRRQLRDSPDTLR